MIGAAGGIVARTMKSIRAFMESIGVREPDIVQSIQRRDAREYSLIKKYRAIRGPHGQYAFIYFPGADVPLEVDIIAASGDIIHAWWFSPADGKLYTQQARLTDRPFISASRDVFPRIFDPPGSRSDADWVLVLDDAAMNFAPPDASTHNE
jgi:hypothetical protein